MGPKRCTAGADQGNSAQLGHGILVAFLLLIRVIKILLSRLDLFLMIDIFENTYGYPDDFQKLPDKGSKVHIVDLKILDYAIMAHLLFKLREVIDLCLNALLLIKFVPSTKAYNTYVILGISSPTALFDEI